MSNPENNIPAAVTVESLKQTHGEDAEKLYHEICSIGGFGDFTKGDFHGGYPSLDLSGLPDELKTAIAAKLATPPPTPPNPSQLNKPVNPPAPPTNNNEEGK